MITTILLVIVALVAAGGFLVGSKLTGFIATGVLIVLGAFSMITIVQPTEVGVPISFGSVGHPLKSGVHVVAPWVGVETYPVRPFAVDPIDVQARTAQAGSVQYRVQARWHVEPKNATETYMQVRSGDEDVIRDKIVDPSLATATNNVARQFNNLEATTQLTDFEGRLQNELQRQVQPYGITIDQVWIRHTEPDQATANSISQLAQQQQQTKIATERVKTAQQEALAREQEALGAKSAAGDLGNPTATQTFLLCLQAWERVSTVAAQHGATVYANPCGASAPAVVAAK